ncbi:MAG TPA: NifU family protein [bacterium]
MDQTIKIEAHLEPSEPEVCKLTIDRTLLAEGSVSFTDPESAKGSGLAEKLFQEAKVHGVRIAGNTLTVTKHDEQDWRVTAAQIAGVIRAHLGSGEPAVSEQLLARRAPDFELMRRIRELFDSKVNPAIAQHGGFVELTDVREGNVYLRMGGGCHGCGMANVTLRHGIEAMLREQLPEIKDIYDTTDHASGTNPYFAPTS